MKEFLRREGIVKKKRKKKKKKKKKKELDRVAIRFFLKIGNESNLCGLLLVRFVVISYQNSQ